MNKLTSSDFASVLQCRESMVPVRLWAIDLGEFCSRCNGSGHHSRNSMGSTTCYKCNGQKYALPKLTNKLLEQTKAAVAEGKLKPYLEMVARRRAAKVIINGANERCYNELYANPLALCIVSACSRKGKDHWSACYEIRCAYLGIPLNFEVESGSIKCSRSINTLAANMLQKVAKLETSDPIKVEAWVIEFEATKIEILRIAEEGLAQFAQEPWWV